MSLTSYRAAPPRVKSLRLLTLPWQVIAKQIPGRAATGTSTQNGGMRTSQQKSRRPKRLRGRRPSKSGFEKRRIRETVDAFGRPGSDLLSRALRQSTIGAEAFHGRVRNGNGCSHLAITTRSAESIGSFRSLAGHVVWFLSSPGGCRQNEHG